MAVVLAKAKVVRMASITMNELTQGEPQIAVSPRHLPGKKGFGARAAWAGGMARSNEGAEVLVLL